MCIGCRLRRPKDELLRFKKEGSRFVFDRSRKGFGRGVYICFDEECFRRAGKKGFPFSYKEVDEWLRS